MSTDSQQVAAGSVEWILLQIAALPQEKLDALQAAVQGESAFNRTADRCRELSSKLGINESNVRFGLSVLEVIYDTLREDPYLSFDDSKSFRQSLIDLLESQDFASGVDAAKVGDALFPLLFSNESAGDHFKLRVLKDGFIPKASGFSSIVDARPVFSQDRNSIKKFIVAIQVKVDLEDESSKGFVFSLTEESLDHLIQAAETARRKCALLRSALNKNNIVLEQ